MTAARLDRIGPVMQSYIDDGVVVGISTLISRRGKIVHSAQFGYQDREADLPMAEDTIFRIYSMTKPIIATALMMLHEEGAFQLEHPVAKFIPAFGATKVLAADGSLVDQDRPLEVRDLLMHTSGLTYDFMIDTPVADMYRQARIMNDAGRSLEDLVDEIASLPLSSHPGTRWHYSVGVDVAARLVEVLAEQRLSEFLATRLFDPLGMVDTGFGVPPAELGRLAAMYGLPDLIGRNYDANQLVEAALSGFNERIDVSSTYPTDAPEVFARGGLGLFSTMSDYHRFAQLLLDNGAIDGERLLSRKTLELMHTNHLPALADPIRGAGPAVAGHGTRPGFAGDGRRRSERGTGIRRRVRMDGRGQDVPSLTERRAEQPGRSRGGRHRQSETMFPTRTSPEKTA